MISSLFSYNTTLELQLTQVQIHMENRRGDSVKILETGNYLNKSGI